MKTMTLSIAVILAGGIVRAQTTPDWSWTFQRWGSTCGLLFENTNLSASVKAAIRDDVCRTYSFAAPTNVFVKLYRSDDPKYGRFDGYEGLQGNYGCASDLAGWDYKLHNGNMYFHVEAGLSSQYLQKIALTNQYQTAVASLSNFLAIVNGVTTNNVVPADYVQLWWSMEEEQPLALSEFKTDAEFQEFISPYCTFEVVVPSVLNFHYRTVMFGNGLCCRTLFKKRSDGMYENGYDIAYRNGSWRLVLPEF